MKKDDIYIGIATALTGMFFLVMSLPMGLFEKNGIPSAGLFPVFVSSGLILFSLLLIYKGFTSEDMTGYWHLMDFQKDNLRMFLLSLAGILIFMLVWKYIHFTPAIYFLSLFLNWAYKRSWKYNLIFTAVFVTLIIISFEKIMMVQFSV